MDSSVTFGKALTARRKGLGLSQGAAARKAEVARGTWRAWENGTSEPQEFNHVRIERAMEWEPGSVQAILDGDLPTDGQPRIASDPPRDDTERMMWRVAQRGRVPDDEVWPLIDERRERLAKDEAARRGRNHNSA